MTDDNPIDSKSEFEQIDTDGEITRIEDANNSRAWIESSLVVPVEE